MYGQEATLREQVVNDYKDDLAKLMKYLPYLEKKCGNEVSNFYEGDEEHKVIPVPVYDSTLLAFVKEAQRTKFITRNYPYAYCKWKMPTPKAERIALESATIRDIDMIKGVMSKYILGGMSKSALWTTAVQEGIFVAALNSLYKLIFEYSSDPKEDRPQKV